MKKVSIILNIVLILVTLFFVFYANIQAKLAQEQSRLTQVNAKEAAANLKMVEMKLEECQKQNQNQ